MHAKNGFLDSRRLARVSTQVPRSGQADTKRAVPGFTQVESLGASWGDDDGSGGAGAILMSDEDGQEGEPAERAALRKRRLDERRARVARSLAEQQARERAAHDEAAARSNAAEELGSHLLAWTKRNKVCTRHRASKRSNARWAEAARESHMRSVRDCIGHAVRTRDAEPSLATLLDGGAVMSPLGFRPASTANRRRERTSLTSLFFFHAAVCTLSHESGG